MWIGKWVVGIARVKPGRLLDCSSFWVTLILGSRTLSQTDGRQSPAFLPEVAVKRSQGSFAVLLQTVIVIVELTIFERLLDLAVKAASMLAPGRLIMPAPVVISPMAGHAD